MEAVLGLFYQKKDVSELTERVDEKESKSDRIERALITGIFSTKMDTSEKILLKEIVVNTGEISDQAENVADRLTLALIKRRI